LDEPLGALDTEFRELMCGELRALHERLRATMVYVTHDQLEAMALADTILLMNEGTIEQVGPPQEIYDRPASRFAAGFIGSPPMNMIPFHGNLLPGDASVRVGEATVDVPEAREGAADSDLVLGARPEHVRLEESSRLRASVLETEHLGTHQIITLQTVTGTMVKARLPSHVQVRPGDATGLAFHGKKLSVFNGATGRVLRSRLHEEPSHG